jgi:hypothetical protein
MYCKWKYKGVKDPVLGLYDPSHPPLNSRITKMKKKYVYKVVLFIENALVLRKKKYMRSKSY